MTAEGYSLEGPSAAWGGGAPADRRRRAVEEARQHTALVRKLRLVLPLAALALVGVIVGVKMLASGPIAGVSIGRVTIKDGKLTMENARVTGHRKDSRSYELLADKAIQDPRDTSIVNLEKIDAVMTEEDNGWTKLKADFGVYFTEQEKVDLKQNIVVTNDEGQVVHMHTARVDLQLGEVVTDQPVLIEFADGTLRAQTMRIEEKGDVMHFVGAVRLNFVPSKDETDKGGSADARQ